MADQIEKKTVYQISKINDTLLDLLIGILLWGILCQVIPIWFLSDKLKYSIGLWIGTITAGVVAYRMWWAIDQAVNTDRGGAEKMIRMHGIVRYILIVLVLGLVYYLNIGDVFSAFLGIIGLKVAVYIQPFTHKLCLKLQGSKK